MTSYCFLYKSAVSIFCIVNMIPYFVTLANDAPCFVMLNRTLGTIKWTLRKMWPRRRDLFFLVIFELCFASAKLLFDDEGNLLKNENHAKMKPSASRVQHKASHERASHETHGNKDSLRMIHSKPFSSRVLSKTSHEMTSHEINGNKQGKDKLTIIHSKPFSSRVLSKTSHEMTSHEVDNNRENKGSLHLAHSRPLSSRVLSKTSHDKNVHEINVQDKEALHKIHSKPISSRVLSRTSHEKTSHEAKDSIHRIRSQPDSSRVLSRTSHEKTSNEANIILRDKEHLHAIDSKPLSSRVLSKTSHEMTSHETNANLVNKDSPHLTHSKPLSSRVLSRTSHEMTSHETGKHIQDKGGLHMIDSKPPSSRVFTKTSHEKTHNKLTSHELQETKTILKSKPLSSRVLLKTSHEKTSHENNVQEENENSLKKIPQIMAESKPLSSRVLHKTSHEKTSHETNLHGLNEDSLHVINSKPLSSKVLRKTSHEKTSHELTSHEKTSHEASKTLLAKDSPNVLDTRPIPSRVLLKTSHERGAGIKGKKTSHEIADLKTLSELGLDWDRVSQLLNDDGMNSNGKGSVGSMDADRVASASDSPSDLLKQLDSIKPGGSPKGGKGKIPQGGPGKGAKQGKILMPWKGEKCEDKDASGCSKFKPMCKIMQGVAFYSCRKTCGLCEKDKPKGKQLVAAIKGLKGQITFSQSSPGSTVFMAACFDKENKLLKKDKEYGLTIHTDASIKDGGLTCADVGPDFNPYNTLHGGPLKSMKHVGDLGNLRFQGPAPKGWPDDQNVPKCKSGQLGGYGVYNHLDLYAMSCLDRRPIVVHAEKDDLGESKTDREDGHSGKALACGKLAFGEGGKGGDMGEEGGSGSGGGEEKGTTKKGGGGPLAMLKSKLHLLGNKLHMSKKDSSEEKSGQHPTTNAAKEGKMSLPKELANKKGAGGKSGEKAAGGTTPGGGKNKRSGAKGGDHGAKGAASGKESKMTTKKKKKD